MRKRSDKSKRSHWSKSKSQKVHTLRRCFQRYGFRLSKKGYADIVRQIQSGEARFVEKQSNRVSIFEVYCKGEKIMVVYDCTRKTIASFLPREGGLDYEEQKKVG